MEAGVLHQLHPGVYAVGHTLVSARGRSMAAVLACGPGAVLSHGSAAALHGLLPRRPGPIDVTAATRSRRQRPGIRVHRARHLDPADCEDEDGIRVTTIPRTLLDIAETRSRADLAKSLEAADRQQVLDVGSIKAVIGRNPGRHGTRPLTEALEAYRPVPDIRSELERVFYELCRSFALPLPAMNVLVAGELVDAVWHDARLVIELDSHAYHGTRAAFERDRARDAKLQLAGYRVVRLTYRRLMQQPEALARMLRSLLARGPH